MDRVPPRKRARSSPCIYRVGDDLTNKILEYLDAKSLLVVEGSISRWRPLISARWAALDQDIASAGRSRAETPRKRVWRFEKCASFAGNRLNSRRSSFEFFHNPCEFFLRFGREDQSVIWQGFIGPPPEVARGQGWTIPSLDQRLVIDEAREREILENWPELTAYHMCLEWDTERHGGLGFAIEDGDEETFQDLESIMKNVTLTIVGINEHGVEVYYSAKGLFGFEAEDYGYAWEYWMPFDEEDSGTERLLVRFMPDHLSMFGRFGIVHLFEPEDDINLYARE